MENRKIFILLTQFPGIDSRALRLWTRFPYSHASIGLEEDMNTFYSFIVKGFIVEDINRYNRPGRKSFPCVLYELEVAPDIYQSVRQALHSFIVRRKSLRYTRLGLILSLIHIPWKLKDRYICSHFVAETLQRCRAARLKKPPTLYLPKDFSRLKELRMVFRGDLLHMVRHFGITGA